MKKYKQILAGLLAMNLAVYVMPTGMVQISASVQNQNSENKDTEKIETNSVESADTTNSVEANSLDDESENAVSVQAALSDAAETDISEDFSTGDGTDTPEDNASDNIADTPEDTGSDNNTNTESPEENQNDNASADMTEPSAPTDSANTDLSDSTEDAFSDGTQPEEAKAAVSGEDVAVQAEGIENKPILNNFIHYKPNTKSIDVESNKELILLSNCDAKEIKDITINIKISGEINLTTNYKIAATDNISSFYNDTAAVSVEETQNSDTDDTQVDSLNVPLESADGDETSQNTGDADVLQETEKITENVSTEEASQNNDTPSAKAVIAGQEYTFQGIGTKDVPFQGTITGEAISVNIDRAFFGGLSSKAKFSLKGNANLPLHWCGDGTKPMIADLYQFDDGSENDHELPVTVTKGTDITAMGSLLGIVQEANNINGQTLVIKNVVTYSDSTVEVSSADDAGLICNTLKSGNICLDGYVLPSKAYEVESTAASTDAVGNAGGFIGLMGKNTTLKIKSMVNTPDDSKVTASNGNAGGMVGLMYQGAKIITENNANVTLEQMTVTGGISAGGVVGTAEDVSFTDEEIASAFTVNSATVKGEDTSTSNIGGFIGKYTINAKNSGDALGIPSNVKIENPKLKVKNDGLAGGYFGWLELKGQLTYTISGTGDEKKTINPTYQDCAAEAAGAIAGKVTSDTIKSTLLIQNVQATVTNSSGENIQYHGGLLGKAGTANKSAEAAYLKVGDTEVKVKNPSAKNETKKGFGGVAGLLAQGSILQAENITIFTPDDSGNACGTAVNRGGGLVGYAEKSVINLSGTTDLSGVGYQKDAGKNNNDPRTGWLVGYQDSALIYANGDGNGNGWSYIRGKESGVTKQAMNDIGNYGQIIRLHSKGSSEAEKSKLSSDLITINDTTHTVFYRQDTAPTVNGNTITLGSADAFARLSIAWNTRGYFGDVAGIQQDVKPQSKDITLTSDVDLTGSGITGLSRDTYSTDDTYAGTFDGGGHTITLASGETFGFKQDKNSLAEEGADGYGEVISAGASHHGRQGIFAKMSTATIQNLTVDGNIWISNNGSNDILVGGIAAELSAVNSKINISGVTVKEKITADGAGGSGLMLGGFFGGSYDSGIEVNLNDSDTSNTAAAVISINGCPNDGTNDRRIIAGGVIGELGEQTFSINVKCLTIEGSIETDARKSAYIGGLIGTIKGNYESTNHYIKVSNIVFDDFTIKAQNASDMCGGLFGSIWASVEVVLQTPTDTDKDAVDVQNATINAKNAASVGGFAYRAGGKWEIQDRGINLNTFSIKAKKDVGLLVCQGEQAKEQLSGGEKQIAALYLSTTKYWENAYKISENNVSVNIAEANGVFDEFVAYTTSTSWNSTAKANVSDILKNNKNGIISIATQDVTENGKTTRIGVDPSNTCTTYQNRTTYGKTKHNKWSRYYYDLDQCLKDIKDDSVYGNNKNLDTPQELLIWSVYTYADNTLKKYFSSFPACIESLIKIGGDSTRANLDMKKYSYYPITYTGGSVNVQNANIEFHNQEIENIETASYDKKLTQGQTAGDYTQHYTMHCGLFLTYQSVNNSRAGAPLYVNNVTLSGSIGKVNNATSGALVADLAGGYDNMYSAISINNTKLDNLKVNDCGEGYAPLLVNRISLNLNLTVNTISTVNYAKGTPVASSLIGTVGSTSAENITMNFQNIKLPDKKADGTADGGIFSHATLLESYTYKKDSSTSNATYIFYYKDDWGEETPHHDNVTYGKEITNSTEFAGIQKWYYDEKLHGTDDGLVYDSENNKAGFDASGYLPYVCVSYNEANCTHEIKVNQRVENILEGCGTYSHPYRITKAAEMNILSEYLSSGMPQKDWRVRVTKSQASVHTSKNDADYSSDEDVVYQYDGNGNWVQVENKAIDGTENWQSVNGGKNTLGKDFMLNYLLNAYYDIQGSVIQGSGSTEKQLILNDFKGFGSDTNPFRGVITSSNNTTLVLKGNRTGNGLIPYSYGSVVKNLKISYRKSDENQGKTLTYEEKDAKSETYPKVAFGGVIGCAMGGDNIIDGVTIEMDDTYLTLSAKKSYLIQVGGYVGSVSGGGIIFRNMTDNAGLTNGKVAGLGTNKFSNLYVNPYVGRVMNGFAFYEKTSDEQNVVTTLENTNKNYKINTLTAGTHLDVNDNAITVKDAEGLLILSAIVNSGAASGGNSLAYSRLGDSQNTEISYSDAGRNVSYTFGGKYGKVRNAEYSEIGTNSTDATDSIAEDQKLPGGDNLPYLIRKYGNNQTAIFSAVTDSMINLSGSASGFDMTNYENGYQGIGARYVSNAIRGYSSSSPTPVNNPENLVPEVKMFNGNNKTVTVDMQVSEYADDDFPAASVGGIFNAVRVSHKGTLSSVVIKQKANLNSTQTDADSSDGTKTTAGISLAYYDSKGVKADTTCNNKKEVGLGGFAGSLVGYTNNNANRDITVTSIQTNGLTIDSPASAGGIFGNVGKPAEHKNSNIAILLQPQESQMTYGVAFNNCSYQNLNVTGKYAAGGFAGYIGNTDQNPKSTVNENDGTQTTINAEGTSSITATDNTSWAGGLFGYVKTRMFINMTDGGEKKESKITLQNVAVSAGTAVGGCIGYIDTKRYGIYNVTVKGTNSSKVNISLNSTTTGTFYAGGIVGYAKGGWNDWHPENWNYEGYIGGSSIENVQINTLDMAGKHNYVNTGEIKTNYITGGIAGQTAGGKTRMEGCTVTSSDIYGSVASGIAGQTDSQMEFTGCEIKGTSENSQTNIKGFSTAGGILGFWTGGQTVTIQGCKIQYLNAEGKDWGSGAIIGDAKGDGAGTLYLFDTSAQDSTVTAAGNRDNGGGRWPCVGSIIGNLRNTIKASNVLFSAVKLDGSDGANVNNKSTTVSKGLLFGNVNEKTVNIAGISIQNIPDDNKSLKLAGDNANINTTNSYIAFADYSGNALNVTESDSHTGLLDVSDAASPYVVISPKSTMSVYENDTSEKYLYGDGVSWTGSNDSFSLEAKKIWDDRNTKNVNGTYSYNNTGVDKFDFESTTTISTYNKNQTTQAENNFPVIQISAGNTQAVTDYLDILTNGGFSKANSANKQKDIHVEATASVYEYTNKKFVQVQENDEPVMKAFRVSTAADGKITFSTTTDYDNGKDRFTLLKVTFTEKDGAEKEYKYNIFVPVLVRRMLEMDFTATLTYGTDFKNLDYKKRDTHVLESFGSSITGYLTYTYNSAAGTYTDYGWESYINAGGNVMEMKKSIKFQLEDVRQLPKGMQLTLVDAKSGNAYYYSATGNEEYKEGGINIPFEYFRDSSGKAYVEPSISELVGAKAEFGGENPIFIKVDATGKPENSDADTDDKKEPTVKIKNATSGKYEYYRLANSERGERGEYSITVDENTLKKETDGKVSSEITENYYLVITVPKDSESLALNGSIQTTINSDIPNQIHYQKINGEPDEHSNSASTYVLSNGYTHVLEETENRGVSQKLSMSDSTLKVSVKDTITFPNDQLYNKKDELYMRFVGGLQKTISSNTSGTSASAEQFPSGTTGTANFYVYTMEKNGKNYYTYNNGSWSSAGDTEQTAVSYQWTSTGGNMELPLSTDGKNAINLQELRDLIQDKKTTGNSIFYVEVKMDATIPGAGLDVIPESKTETDDNPEDYVKLTYYSQLSTESQSLTYSSNRAILSTTMTEYYREEPSGVELTYDADKIDQLGINLLDLQRAYLDAEEQNTYIDTTATYDLSSMKNLKDTLKNSLGIKFTLTLMPKNTASESVEEEYGSALKDAQKYLSVELRSQNSGKVDYDNNGTWSWTVPKESYYDMSGDQITTSSVFDGSKLLQAIRLKVNVANIEEESHFYSNYKVVLTAEILDKNSSAVQNTHKDDNIIYTLAKIKPEFVDKNQ